VKIESWMPPSLYADKVSAKDYASLSVNESRHGGVCIDAKYAAEEKFDPCGVWGCKDPLSASPLIWILLGCGDHVLGIAQCFVGALRCQATERQ